MQTLRDRAELQPAAGTDARWWRGAVIYQVYPRSFLDTNADGIGDLPGVTRGLDYIAGLGVDAIWISPFFPSPMKDFGYDISDYCGVDPIFGTLADFDELIKEAHARGLKVMIDQVWSHASDQHPWFAESRASRDNAKADWFVWSDPKSDGAPPNNWQAVFGGSAWSWDARRRQYYLHHFLASQPQLNLRHPDVVEALFDAGRFWLGRGVDGFRLDAIDFMFHDPLLADNPPRQYLGGAMPARPFGMQRHTHDMLHPDLLPFFARIRGLMAEYPGTATLGEISSEPGAFERCSAYTDTTAGRLDMAYTLDLMKRELSADSLQRTLREAEAAVRTGCICWAFSNHDVVRATTRWGGENADAGFARLLLALLLTLPGSTCLYQGEELALAEAQIAPGDMIDPYGRAFYPLFKGRDGARTPMPWTAGARQAGFTAAARSWLPVDPAHHERAVDRQEGDADSPLNFTRRFLRWRKALAPLRLGQTRLLDLAEPIFALERRHGDEVLVAAFNVTGKGAFARSGSLPRMQPLEGHGFAAAYDGDRLFLPAHGAFFGRVLP